MSRQPAPLVNDAAATLALCGYTVAVAIGFARVFSGWPFLSDLVTIAIVGHGFSFLLRRARVNGWLAVPALGVVLVWLLTVLHYRDTMTSPIPWSSTLARVRFDLGYVRGQFPTAIAPVLYDVVGWAALASISVALVVVLSDSFAFRAEARGEALVPGGVLFVFIAALSSPRLRIASTVVLVAAGIVAVIALRRLHDRDRGAVLRSRRRTSLAVPIALATALGISVMAGFIGPRLPGANAEPLYDTKGRGGTNFVDSPIVDLRSRLTNQGDTLLFQINADQPRYWRSVTLAEYDGRQFTLPDQRLAAVPSSGEGIDADDRVRIRQQIQVVAPGGKFVPAAADARFANGSHADGDDFAIKHPTGTRDLIVDDPLEAGDLVTVDSYAVSATPDELRSAGSGGVPDPIYLDLPDDTPDVVYETTEQLTADQPTSYDKAMALQNWFRDPDEFTYSLEVQSGHGSDAIESFFRVRAGYCEQFAGTFAVMARAAGIPSRVAVGYTQGTLDARGWYSVIGKNSHAWPELWFEGVGWVPFEPTPGRGAPGAEAYTGLEPAQDTTGPGGGGDGSGGGGPTEPIPTSPPTFVDPDAVAPQPTQPPRSGPAIDDGGAFPTPDQLDDLVGGAAADPADDSGFALLPTLVSLTLMLLLAGPWLIRALLRFRRRGQSTREHVTAAWTRARSAAHTAGVAGTPAMTPMEWTRATAVVLPVAARPMRSLAEVVDRVTFAPADEVDLDKRGTFGDSLSDDCVLWANQIDRIATDTLTTPQRLKRYFTTFN